MSEARLRRLDVLFAERVLGLRFISLPNGDRVVETDGIYSSAPSYTRSLDAAWEGATSKYSTVDLSFHRGSSHVEIETSPGYEDMADASHPAEALVLACLRAMGVSEEELA